MTTPREGPSVGVGVSRLALAAVLLCAVGCDDASGGAPDGAGDALDGGARDGTPAAPRDGGPDGAPDARLVADGTVDAGPGASLSDAAPDAAASPLVAVPGPSRYALVGEAVVLDGSASTGAVSWQWHFGNGDGWPEPRPEPRATVTYNAPGRYRATLTVFDAAGARRTAGLVVTATPPPTVRSRHSATVAIQDGRVAVVVPDADLLVFVAEAPDADGFAVVRRVPTCDVPRTLSFGDGEVAVACEGDDALLRVPLDAARPPTRTPLPPGSRPYGVVLDGATAYVTLPATGEVARVQSNEITRFSVGPDPRGVALSGDRVLVSRWRSPPDAAVIYELDPATGDVTLRHLAFDPQRASDTEIGGVPSYLDQVLVAPDGREIALPSLQANVGGGLFRDGEPLRFDTTVRAVVSFLDGATHEERFPERKQFDERGFASAAVYSRFGDFLYVAGWGSRSVDRLDRYERTQSGSILDVGYAPAGLALSADDRFLFADASLSRELVIYDVTRFDDALEPVARLRTVEDEPLAPAVLRGKQLFNDSFDPRLSAGAYVACAHCHLDGDADNFVWDFTDRGEGLRNTISLVGRAGTGHGAIHWSANFDEVQDFEHDIRGPFGGTGLLDDADFATHGETLGAPKAGLSPDLDALAAYLTSLDRFPPSPERGPDGAPSESAVRGRAVFEAGGCGECHAGPTLTDSGFDAPDRPRLHDVGTLGPGSGQRLRGPLTGLDTPTLYGLARNPPYLHDGSALTLEDVLTRRNPDDRHGATGGLTPDQLADLVAYLRGLDGRP